jgi:DNA helicase IV
LFEASSHVKISLSRCKRKETDDVKSFEELSKEQAKRENALLSKLMGGVDIGELADFEAELSERQSEILFKITTEIEDTQDALNQVEQLAQRLRRHLERLKKLHQTLSK